MNVYVSSNSQHVIFVDKPLKLMLKCVLDTMKLMIWIVVSKKERKTKTGVLASLNYKTFCWCGRVRFHFKMKNINQNLHEFAKNLRSDHNPWMFVNHLKDAFEVEIPHLLI